MPSGIVVGGRALGKCQRVSDAARPGQRSIRKCQPTVGGECSTFRLGPAPRSTKPGKTRQKDEQRDSGAQELPSRRTHRLPTLAHRNLGGAGAPAVVCDRMRQQLIREQHSTAGVEAGPDSAAPATVDGGTDAASEAGSNAGTQGPGQPCAWPSAAGPTVHADAGHCNPSRVCVGTLSTTACTKDSDCLGPHAVVAQCVNGKCGESFCTRLSCSTASDCSDFGTGACCGTTNNGAQAACMPAWLCGTGAAGDPCPFDTNVNQSSPVCAKGLQCVGVGTFQNVICKQDSDCAGLPGHAQCVNGSCGSSFCSPSCDSSGNCPSGFAPEKVGSTCDCNPSTPVGTAKAGDACRYDNVNLSAPYCQSGLTCVDVYASSTSEACSTASDCSTYGTYPTDCVAGHCFSDANATCKTTADCSSYGHPGTTGCVAGHCSSSLCVANCDASGNCPTGQEPLTNAGVCYCVPN